MACNSPKAAATTTHAASSPATWTARVGDEGERACALWATVFSPCSESGETRSQRRSEASAIRRVAKVERMEAKVERMEAPPCRGRAAVCVVRPPSEARAGARRGQSALRQHQPRCRPGSLEHSRFPQRR
eukprot:4713530-Pleurochrysis_carterae.AAC.1